ncbi:hypothetical protein JW962_03485 [Candidatus Dojkabacteria bacterium]|nr:hypothetical protein [Candidatus Dojkabacteria bacterium]
MFCDVLRYDILDQEISSVYQLAMHTIPTGSAKSASAKVLPIAPEPPLEKLIQMSLPPDIKADAMAAQ